MEIRPRICLARILLVFLIVSTACFGSVNAVDLKKCGQRIQSAQEASWNATNHTTTAPPLNLSRTECIEKCGGGLGDVSWGAFSQDFGAWFLPWIALAFQIPFGGERPLQDVFNFFMTVGSPALAAYSLQITHLNAAWLSKEFSDLKYPNAEAIPKVISAFQHVPIQILTSGASLRSLIVLRKNDDYWEYLLKGVKRTRRWSIPLFVGFVWVILAALLTIFDSFASPPTDSVEYSTVAAWTYLLPLIMGWMIVGTQPEPNHLKECLDGANQKAWVAADGVAPIPTRYMFGKIIQGIRFMEEGDVDNARKDELKTVPVFNYARAFIWSLWAEHILSLVRDAAAEAERRIPVDNGLGKDVDSVASDGSNEGRPGSEEQVVDYSTETLVPPEGALEPPSPTYPPSPLPNRTPGSSNTSLPVYHKAVRQSRWAPGIWGRVALAAFLALGLQWGTVGAAVSIHYWQPPTGLGCRTLSFLLYGIAATISMFFCLAASILAHASRPLHGTTSRFEACLDGGALLCGYLGKAFAFISGAGIIIICAFHSSGVYNNCICASTTFDRGIYDVVILAVDEVVGPGTIRIWICALVTAFLTDRKSVV